MKDFIVLTEVKVEVREVNPSRLDLRVGKIKSVKKVRFDTSVDVD